MERREIKEDKDLEEVEENNKAVAAFFDLDGTLVRLPSLEKRFFLMLRYRKLIGFRNYFLWLVESARLLPRGINQAMHANKMYLRGLRVLGGAVVPVSLVLSDGSENERCEPKEKEDQKRRQAGMPVPLFAEAIERVAWHVERGHLLVLVSGTLEVLAHQAVRALRAELSARGLTCAIRTSATRLEEENERWTGRIAGDAMFGEAKARAVQKIAAEENLDLQRCFAYGDSTNDRRMLETVGKPAAVNPSNDLARIARRNDWPVLRWGTDKTSTQRTPRAQRSQRTNEGGDELQIAKTKVEFRT